MQLKNRYTNILPPEQSRVILPAQDYGTDYMNANWVDGITENSKRKFVATQGPTENTVLDFWSTVWNCNCSVIVMLTKLIESDRIKCTCYWPDIQNPISEGRFNIILVEDNPIDEGTMEKRIFKIVDTTTNQERIVTQLQFLAWPDHGVLDSPQTFLMLADHANELNKPFGPILIHCSAGVGRTGTFVVISNVLEKLAEDAALYPHDELYIDVPSALLQLRKERSYSIQTAEQYVFVYRTIQEGAKRILDQN